MSRIWQDDTERRRVFAALDAMLKCNLKTTQNTPGVPSSVSESLRNYACRVKADMARKIYVPSLVHPPLDFTGEDDDPNAI
jgi:hypothetical protein